MAIGEVGEFTQDCIIAVDCRKNEDMLMVVGHSRTYQGQSRTYQEQQDLVEIAWDGRM